MGGIINLYWSDYIPVLVHDQVPVHICVYICVYINDKIDLYYVLWVLCVSMCRPVCTDSTMY